MGPKHIIHFISCGLFCSSIFDSNRLKLAHETGGKVRQSPWRRQQIKSAWRGSYVLSGPVYGSGMMGLTLIDPEIRAPGLADKTKAGVITLRQQKYRVSQNPCPIVTLIDRFLGEEEYWTPCEAFFE